MINEVMKNLLPLNFYYEVRRPFLIQQFTLSRAVYNYLLLGCEYENDFLDSNEVQSQSV